MSDKINPSITDYIDPWTFEHVRNVLQPTEEELIYFVKLMQLLNQKRKLSVNFDYNPSVVIDDFLYHGTINHARNMKLLRDLNIRHIINTCHVSLEEEIMKNFNVLWVDMQDEEDVNINQYFEKTNDFLLSCKEKKEKVLVHCQMGISRSSSIVLAYLMKYHHDTLIKAYDFLLDRRPISCPNPSFLMQLIRYEKKLRNSGLNDKQNNNDDDKQNPIKVLDIPNTSNFEWSFD
ncbi:unnamed protein product [Adineta steineri]|uniref:protein-tyrosine-phosphatase n=1 Tax=Adineta steineri TaxID=433720 RepID=A0A819ZM11_9BILA|nr:unnamed protein product [Adineta steineri]CAF4172974.1 unnamed protein product [Adineta steineri]